MHVVAIHSLTADKQGLAGALAAVLGVTAYEALARLRVPGDGPFVVALFAEQERAVGLAGQLESGGFRAMVLGAGEIEKEAGQRAIRRFGLNEQDLTVVSDDGKSLTIAYRDIDLILRGTAISSTTSTETTTKRALSLGNAVLSGGLKMTKTTKSTRDVTKEEREGFFILYAGDGPPLAFSENGLVYDALGSVRGPSHSANFLQLSGELRRRCPGARYDERLLNKAGLAALLGPSLSPEEHLVVATALLAKALRGKA